MTRNRLEWRSLQPDTESALPLFTHLGAADDNIFSQVQPRLCDSLRMMQVVSSAIPLMLVKIAENAECQTIIKHEIQQLTKSNPPVIYGGSYSIEDHLVSWRPADSLTDNFAGDGGVYSADWIESEQLFGCLRLQQQAIHLEAGLLHRANGGTLILSLRTLLAQPLLWLRLKQILTTQRFTWLSPDETRPLPLSIPSMPITFRLILTGERDALADFQEMEPELSALAIYSEFEDNIQTATPKALELWAKWVLWLARYRALPLPETSAWPILIAEAVRYTGEQHMLPLCPAWIVRQLQEAVLYSDAKTISGESLQTSLTKRAWREGFLAERVRDEILYDQIIIETQGEAVGQINALSVIEFPGHPRAFGEPSRISCVVHAGDGEFTDVERKAELGGNIHAKGMMIMQAWLTAELALDQPLPVSASLVFEQSYSEVDGDSASLAELCSLISALSNQPVAQYIAVTGSVDQFGNVQPVGGLNEKIEGFFHICHQRQLNGQQGVIIPTANVRHLSLQQEVVTAVRNDNFHIWAVSNVYEALPLLMGMQWDKETEPCLLRLIQDRIAQINHHEARYRAWPLRWLNWFNQR